MLVVVLLVVFGVGYRVRPREPKPEPPKSQLSVSVNGRLDWFDRRDREQPHRACRIVRVCLLLQEDEPDDSRQPCGLKGEQIMLTHDDGVCVLLIEQVKP